jgi:hypothetical protein
VTAVRACAGDRVTSGRDGLQGLLGTQASVGMAMATEARLIRHMWEGV